MKVNFMVIGAMKCGTATLCRILRYHEQISFSTPREPHFFSKTQNWKNEIKNYEKLFQIEKGKIYGEGSTTYTCYPHFNLEIWKDIYEYNPNMKFIYIVREPISRCISQYMHMYERGYLDCSIEDAILNIPNLINYGRYYTQIKPFINQFGKKNVLIIDFDKFINKKKKTLKKIADFLNIDFNKFHNYDNIHINKSLETKRKHHKFDNPKNIMKFYEKILPKKIWKNLYEKITDNSKRAFLKKPVLSREYKEMIINLTRLEIIELEKLTGKKYTKWLNN